MISETNSSNLTRHGGGENVTINEKTTKSAGHKEVALSWGNLAGPLSPKGVHGLVAPARVDQTTAESKQSKLTKKRKRNKTEKENTAGQKKLPSPEGIRLGRSLRRGSMIWSLLRG